MNGYDSQWMKEILLEEGYDITDEVKEAGLVLINTCSVRENPENKVYSLLGRLNRLKRQKPGMIIGVGGCVAQQEGEAILKRESSVNMVFGTDCFFQLPEMIKQVKEGKRVVYTDWLERHRKIQNFIPDEKIESARIEGNKAMIAITKGCDNFCSFCIVPTTRGRLVSREAENIIAEAQSLIKKGVKEILLLGQNVNSYQTHQFSFAGLLKSVADLEGLTRLRFTSPHPNDWDNGLTDLMASHPKICNQIHLPIQAGSDRILELMRRGHTVMEYLDKVNYIKTKIPSISFSTDIIVGFPGETDDEFEKTLEILRAVRYSHVYAFKYSSRPGTKAAEMENPLTEEIKQERLSKLILLQEKIQEDLFSQLIGTKQTVLIDNAHPKENGTMNGRTDSNIPISIPETDLTSGELAEVFITRKKQYSLVGRLVRRLPH